MRNMFDLTDWANGQPRPQGAFPFRLPPSPCVKVRSPGDEDGQTVSAVDSSAS